jgi:amidase
VSSLELVEASLARIAARNPALQAFVTVTAARARRAARRADAALVRARKTGAAVELPVFHGVPTAIKDIDMVAFTPMKAGSRQTRYFIAPVDGAAARHNRAAGAVILGKTATSELAILPMIETDIHPPARNPWHPDYTPGGSSGGAAAAVAAGMLPIAHASDGAGSIRIPASFCGLVGFKPSRGALPSFYLPADKIGLTYTLCVAHDVADSAAYVDVLQGRYRPQRDPESMLARSARTPKPQRIRVVLASPLVKTDPQIAAAVERAAGRLAALGHAVDYAPPVDIGTYADFIPIMARSVANVPLPGYRYVQPLTAWMHKLGRGYAHDDVAARFAALRQRIIGWMQGADVVLSPTVALPVPKVGALYDADPERMFYKAAELGAFTAAFNVSGHPAVSVPMGRDANGLPMGLQIVGPLDGDALVLQLARQLEPFAT